jgi:hypothetical protein
MKTEHVFRSAEHLTEVQFGELLDASANKADRTLTPAEEHLLVCEQCAAELATLRESLVLFRGATSAYANDQLRNSAPIPVPARPLFSPVLRPMYFAAAAVLMLATFLPVQMLRQRSQRTAQQTASGAATDIQTYATESNEALLDDVDRASSASVPDSMQALADPTANNDLSVQKSNQRKD